jgi:hypothetical protein
VLAQLHVVVENSKLPFLRVAEGQSEKNLLFILDK